MLGEDGQKMSKSKRNYREPKEIFDRYGADALRWYFFATQPPWTTIRYSEQAIKESIPEFLLRFWNVYSFFVIYANIDGFDPAKEVSGQWSVVSGKVSTDNGQRTTDNTAKTYRPVQVRSELDRWILSELHRTIAGVTQAMGAYDNFAACQQLTAFVDALSNWYVRRSRDRFWMSDKRADDKLDAYWTLYECLVTTTKLVAPFVPFVAETIWQNLGRSGLGEQAAESVHLCDYPSADSRYIDEALSERMGLVREIASLGRAARSSAKLKVRQPLAKVEVVLADTAHLDWLREHTRLIEEELNVKAVEFTTEGQEYITYTIVPNFKRLGPRLGKNMPLVKKLLGEAEGGELINRLKSDGKVVLELPGVQPIELDEEDVEVRLEAKAGWSASQGRQCVVVLSTELTDELVQEGLARDVVRAIQDRRKEIGCDFTDRITVGLVTEDRELTAAMKTNADYIKHETLTNTLVLRSLPEVEPIEVEIGEKSLRLFLKNEN
jgi:isoleucyl-tRNA synthetase